MRPASPRERQRSARGGASVEHAGSGGADRPARCSLRSRPAPSAAGSARAAAGSDDRPADRLRAAPPGRLPPPPPGPGLRLAAGPPGPRAGAGARHPTGPGGLRWSRSTSAAAAGRAARCRCPGRPALHLTASGRRTTAFTEIARPAPLERRRPRHLLALPPRPRMGAGGPPSGPADVEAAAGMRCCCETTRPWCRWRRCPAATTTTSRRRGAAVALAAARPLSGVGPGKDLARGACAGPRELTQRCPRRTSRSCAASGRSTPASPYEAIATGVEEL